MEIIKAHIRTELYYTEIKSASGNLLISDEPESVGGKNRGFTPTELLASSLASCTAITLKMYANRKEWDVTDVIVSVDFDRNTETQVSLFRRKIEIIGEVDDKQKERMLTIANSCPIHKVLAHTIEVETTLYTGKG